ncbi:hypothetical protein [Nonomuraea sp. NPDC050783]|uniref:hypothetical protein n=1 Tax=Nonomuraea sp. NPDC050783 TaxID=3154634 RepID=UPI003465A55C
MAVICVGMFLSGPEGMAATAGAGRAVAARRRGQVAVLGAQIAMLLIATVLSVFKPRWGLR